jgi:bacillithiol biosynthesis deacetylase BshB1
MSVDVLAIGAHPDDVEMIAGGTIAKLIDRGRQVAIVDMTRGEMGTRGTPEARAAEAADAARTLGVCERVNLELPDGRLENTEQARVRVVEQIRRLRPKLVMTHYWDDLHPDHSATGTIVRDTMYPAGFANYPAKGSPFRPNEYLFFMAHFTFEPSFIVDITGYWEQKVEAVKHYRSQLHDATQDGLETLISQPTFLKRLEGRARNYGGMIYAEFGEPFLVRRPIPVVDPVDMYEPFPKIFANENTWEPNPPRSDR